RLLCFRYPNNQGLAPSGEFLAREMARVVRSPDRAVFVCHSAGGLVFRDYAERKGSAFDRAIFLGTPHGGSSVIRFKFLLDAWKGAQGFLKVNPLDALSVGPVVEAVAAEGQGEIGHDLEPDSLFLRYLGEESKFVDRYAIVHGRLWKRTNPVLDGLAKVAAR